MPLPTKNIRYKNMPKKVSRYRKRFGQVFLRDARVVENILQSADIASHETVLEIGPGRGVLTTALSQRAKSFYAIELEARYADTLQRRFATSPHIHIIQADARKYDYGQLPDALVVVANLPYSMAMPILRHLFAYRQHLSRLIIMLQHEVAARLLASPNTHAYSALSVFFQYYAAIHHCFDVSRHAFTPVPGVDSTVLSLAPYTVLPWASTNEAFFFECGEKRLYPSAQNPAGQPPRRATAAPHQGRDRRHLYNAKSRRQSPPSGVTRRPICTARRNLRPLNG